MTSVHIHHECAPRVDDIVRSILPVGYVNAPSTTVSIRSDHLDNSLTQQLHEPPHIAERIIQRHRCHPDTIRLTLITDHTHVCQRAEHLCHDALAKNKGELASAIAWFLWRDDVEQVGIGGEDARVEEMGEVAGELTGFVGERGYGCAVKDLEAREERYDRKDAGV